MGPHRPIPMGGGSFNFKHVRSPIHPKREKNENIKERIMIFGYAGLIFGFALEMFFVYLREFAVPGEYTNFAFYGDYDKVNSTFNVISKLGYLARPIGITFFLLAFEICVKRTKYVLTTIQIILIVTMIILPYDLTRIFHHNIVFVFEATSIFIILFLFTKWSRLEFKAISSFLMLGFFLFELSFTLGSRDVKELNVLPLVIHPLLFILGAFLMMLPLIISLEHFSHPLLFW